MVVDSDNRPVGGAVSDGEAATGRLDGRYSLTGLVGGLFTTNTAIRIPAWSGFGRGNVCQELD